MHPAILSAVGQNYLNISIILIIKLREKTNTYTSNHYLHEEEVWYSRSCPTLVYRARPLFRPTTFTYSIHDTHVDSVGKGRRSLISNFHRMLVLSVHVVHTQAYMGLVMV